MCTFHTVDIVCCKLQVFNCFNFNFDGLFLTGMKIKCDFRKF